MRCLAACHLSQLVWERSSRASGDCSGEGRPSKPFRTPHQVCSTRPSPGRSRKGSSDLSPAALGRDALLHVTSPNLFGRGRAEPPAIARVRADRASRFERRIKCARSALTRTKPKGLVRPLPSCDRARWLAVCHLSQTCLGEVEQSFQRLLG